MKQNQSSAYAYTARAIAIDKILNPIANTTRCACICMHALARAIAIAIELMAMGASNANYCASARLGLESARACMRNASNGDVLECTRWKGAASACVVRSPSLLMQEERRRRRRRMQGEERGLGHARMAEFDLGRRFLLSCIAHRIAILVDD